MYSALADLTSQHNLIQLLSLLNKMSSYNERCIAGTAYYDTISIFKPLNNVCYENIDISIACSPTSGSIYGDIARKFMNVWVYGVQTKLDIRLVEQKLGDTMHNNETTKNKQYNNASLCKLIYRLSWSFIM